MKRFKNPIAGLISLVGVFGIVTMGYLFYIMSNLPDVERLKEYAPPLSSRIYSADGEVLLEIGKEKRELTKLEEIPPIIIQAFLSAEDNNFYSHNGVDFAGVVRAMIANIKAGRVVQGGSTITQQVAKSLLLTSERSFQRKLKDFILAIKIERVFSKDEILYLYLNQVYLGGGYHGVKSAVRGYFGKQLSELTIAEAALLAGLLVAPGKYSPYINPAYAKKRQNYVLQRLFKDGKITEEQFSLAKNESIQLEKKGQGELKAPYFTEWVRKRVVELVGNEEFLTQGFHIRTTLNYKLQQAAERAIEKGTRDIDKRQGFEGALEKIEKDQWINFLRARRQEILREVSAFTWFTAEGTLRDEKDFNEESVESFNEFLSSMMDKDEEIRKEFRIKMASGNPEDSEEVAGFEKEKDYKALVISVNNYQKTIFLDMGGIRGVIPFEGFKWAIKREISEKRTDRYRIDRPSQVVKPGDVIWVRLVSKKQKVLKRLVDSKYLQLKLSEKARDMLKEQKYYEFKLEQIPKVQAAIASINPFDGSIVSLVGGKDFSESQFNRAVQSKRQPGSSFKPFIYAAALEEGYTPASILIDTPQALAGVDNTLDWRPRNYDGKFKGPLTLRKCLEESRNVPTITLLQQIGVSKVMNLLDRNDVKINREVDLSIALGSFGYNLLDMVSLYSIFPNGGKKIQFKSITSIKNNAGDEYYLEEHKKEKEEELELAEVTTTSSTSTTTTLVKTEVDPLDNGEIVFEPVVKKIDFVSNLEGDQVMDRRIAFLMTQLLKGVIQNRGGTGRKAASLSTAIGGKTGTTNNYVDAWFIGFSRNLVSGVWTGFDDNTTLGFGETGARAALPIWKEYMKAALDELGERDFSIPPGILNLSINPKTGKKASPSSPSIFREFFVEGTQPGGEYDSEKKYDGLGIIDDDDYYSSQE